MTEAKPKGRKKRSEQPRDLWGEHPLAEGEERVFEFGPLALRARAAGQDLWLAADYAEGEYRPLTPAPFAPATGPQWRRWAMRKPATSLNLSPALPDLPVVVRPEVPFRLAPRAEARIYVRMPLWVRVAAEAGARRELGEIASAVVSKTWWGTQMAGEPAYWIASSAGRIVQSDPERWWMALCPVRIFNAGEDEVSVSRILLRTGALALYRGQEGQHWASPLLVRYRGDPEHPHAQAADGPPEECEGASRAAEPRNPPGRSFTAKSLGGMFDLKRWMQGADHQAQQAGLP